MLFSTASPGCYWMFTACSPLGQQWTLEETKGILKLVSGFICFMLTSSVLLRLQTDWHVTVYVSLVSLDPSTSESSFSFKTVQRVSFLSVVGYLFYKSTVYFFTLVTFVIPSFSHPWWHKAKYYWTVVFFVFYSKTLDSPNKEMKSGKSSWFPPLVKLLTKTAAL